MDEMALFATEMSSVDWKCRVCLGRFGGRHCVGLWLQKDVQPAKMVAFRRVFDSFSTDIRCSFVRFSLVPRSVLDRSSID